MIVDTDSRMQRSGAEEGEGRSTELAQHNYYGGLRLNTLNTALSTSMNINGSAREPWLDRVTQSQQLWPRGMTQACGRRMGSVVPGVSSSDNK